MRFRAYQQLEHSDCGPTCLRMVARHYGRKVPRAFLRQVCDCTRSGISLGGMVDAARRLGFVSEAVKIGLDEAARMPLPAILYWRHSHFVVLYGHDTKSGTYRIADPSGGKVRLGADEFRRAWTDFDGRGIAVLLEPGDTFHSMEYPASRSGGLPRMLRDTLRSERVRFAAVILLLLLVSAADIVSPFLFQSTVDNGIRNRDLPLVWLLILGQFMIFTGNYAASALSDMVLTRMSLRTGISMMDTYLRRLASLPMEFFDRKVSSDLVQKTEDQNRIRDFLLTIPQNVFFTVLNIAVFSGLLIWFSPAVFGFFMAMTAMALGWASLFARRRRELDYALAPRRAENRNNVYELVYGMPEIKANNALANRLARWSRTQRDINRLSYRSAFMNLYINGGNTFLTRLRDIVVTGLSASMVVRGDMTIGGMMTVGYLTGRLSAPLGGLVGTWMAYQDASMSYERLEEILEHRPAPQGTRPVPEGDIALRGVTFRYPGASARPVLRGLDMTVQRGKTTAVVGPSGCGKTTLLRLLLGFYPPSSGSLDVGDVPLADIAPGEWAARTGAVMQEGHVFSGSIAANIAIGEEEPDMERVRDAARTACLDAFVGTLPMGYSTRIGNTGLSLSGGQTQRLLIARAIYRDPELLLLDEATSSLDAGNEREIVDNLRDFARGRTLVVVAHRLSTVCHADRIYFMKDGAVTEAGSHQELISLRGDYYDLIRNQLELGN